MNKKKIKSYNGYCYFMLLFIPCISGGGKGVYGESPCPISHVLDVGIVILLGDIALNRFEIPQGSDTIYNKC